MPIYPIVDSGYEGNPIACALGRKTTWFLDQFMEGYTGTHWAIAAGTPYVENHVVTQDDLAESYLELQWIGRPLTFNVNDHVTLAIRGRIDAENLGSGGAARNGLNLLVGNVGSVVTQFCSIHRTSGNPNAYEILVALSWDTEYTYALPTAYAGRPYEATIRAECFFDRVDWYVDNQLVVSFDWPLANQPIKKVEPVISVGLDTIHRGHLYYFYAAGAPGFPDLCMGTPSAGIARYRQMLIQLLPQGMPWRNLNSLFRLFVEAFAVELDRIQTLSDSLRSEAKPATATTAGLLEEWEEMALLPDEMPDAVDSQAKRQAVVNAKVTTNYTGQSRAFFQSLAANLGMNVTVTDGGSVLPARVGIARVGTARVNSESNAFIFNIQIHSDPNGQISKYQLMVARLKPAHTEVTYT